MPRPKKEGVIPKTRSRHGCWPCKAKKIKCSEERPACNNCQRQGETCDYSIRLNWEGRGRRREANENTPWNSAPMSLGLDHGIQAQHSAPESALASAFAAASHVSGGHYGTMQVAPPPAPPSSSQLQWQNNIDPAISGTKRKRDNNESDLSSLYSERTLPPPFVQSQRKSPFSHTASSQQTPSTLYSTPPDLAGTGPVNPQPESPRQSAHSGRRRLSVQSLLQGGQPSSDSYADDNALFSHYGFDQGLPDLDVPHNDDANALSLQSPTSVTRRLHLVDGDFELHSAKMDSLGHGSDKDSKLQRAEYYAHPVPVRIPKHLEPLPKILRANPMNLLYFHHFLNHTALILVVHDCPENPFKHILAEMALQKGNENLLNLIVAYAACHRSRLLNHRDPRNRIAVLVRDVFPKMRQAVESADHVSEADLATAIMLTSLEIISPNAFEVPVSWQNHLNMAHQMVAARGGFTSLEKGGKTSRFLGRWFAYLDIFGSLSGTYKDRPGNIHYNAYDASDPEGDSEIDCLMAVTNRCISTLAQIANLARECDKQRIGPGGVIRKQWKPSAAIVDAAEELTRSLQRPRPRVYRKCAHRQPDATESLAADTMEMIEINEAFHLAGLIQLQRRVLGKDTSHPDVQTLVHAVAASLDKIRPGGSGEATMIFPMFTAGCEAIEPRTRTLFLERLTTVESFGMTQVHEARTLMQQAWERGRPWETLVSGEFLG